ncbi:Wzz/FepE/Etk N-terminal domain-containing protein [Hydrogenivirga sp. 128-5-R1-1]|uniref:Wzz/FepE/Etk N-terminal domain-containing protein n=1 Tax=Hydrogenivirga sp. 128-5-R1-1 TaxID=392423 RepID=UPI00015EF756|nr:Wzz/FepE/Etk N-terminal domain-containing protein [Hydrogenivirga sp. 128-5-R1-1]EDP75562.1 hypothetical protein HG1285_16400 [Hydrogenivirga sp. 128-5-R1-1]
MEKERKEELYYEDEIDLYELWLKLKKRWRVILVTVVVFIAASVTYLFITKPVYRTSFLIKVPGIITPVEASEYVKSVKRLLKEKRYEEVAKLLSVDKDTVLSIHNLEARELRKSKDVIGVTLEVYDPSVINGLSKAIVNYLNHNELIAEKIELRKRELSEKIAIIENRVKALKETKKLVNRLVEQGGEVYFNPAEIDKTIQSFENQLVSLKVQLKALKGFEISVKPPIPEKPDKPKKKLIIAVAGVSSLFLGVFLALFLEWLEEARRRHEEEGKT